MQAGSRSEALSYWEVAESEGWFGHPWARARAYLEEQARDSFENVLVSICRFKELSDPTQTTVVSVDFKRRRFQNLHRKALRFPDTGLLLCFSRARPGAATPTDKAQRRIDHLGFARRDAESACSAMAAVRN